MTLVHKGNIMKFTEGGFRDWGYALAAREFGAQPIDGGPWLSLEHDGRTITIKDVIADAFLQQILLRPAEYDVIATLNLNGDYISDALAAQVGGIGIAPGANLSDEVAMFEATHGTAPKYAGQDKVNPGSLILSAEMMLRHMGWTEAADLIIGSLGATIADKQVTYDFARLMDGANRGLVLGVRPGDDRAHVAEQLAQSACEPVVDVTRRACRHRSRRCKVAEAVARSLVDVQLHGHARMEQELGVVDALVEEAVGRADDHELGGRVASFVSRAGAASARTSPPYRSPRYALQPAVFESRFHVGTSHRLDPVTSRSSSIGSARSWNAIGISPSSRARIARAAARPAPELPPASPTRAGSTPISPACGYTHSRPA